MLDRSHGDRRIARPTHSYRDRPPARSRVGRMGRRPAPQRRRLLRAPRPVLPLCRTHPGRAVRRGGGRLVPALAPARRGGTCLAPRRGLGRRGGVQPREPVARRPRRFVLWRRGPASRAPARARAVPPAHEPHVASRAAGGAARLGGARGDRRVQRSGGAAWAEGGEGRVAGAHPAVPLEAGAGRRAGDRRDATRCRCSSRRAASWRAG